MLNFARDLVKQENIAGLELVYGSIPNTLSQLIRTALIAPQGKLLLSADFSAIEARVTAWLAGEQWRLEVFATHGKIYEASASQMFGVPIEKIVRGNAEYELRQHGKVAELALGFGGGVKALLKMDSAKALTAEELPEIVQRWRAASPRIRDFWYSLQGAALETVTTGRPTSTHGICFVLEGDTAGNVFLTVTLRSGRKLFYVKPHIGADQWGRPALCYYGMNQKTKKWELVGTWGGKLCENIVQATARDCLVVAMQRVEAAGYPIVFHVHDEVVCEVDEKTAERDLSHICGLMSQPIPWAPGLLLRADGYVSGFYRKD